MVDNVQVSEFSRFDAADYLIDVETAAAYLEAALAESNHEPSVVTAALGAIARSGNMSELARRTGMSREDLYTALSEDGNPCFATIMNMSRALGLRVSFLAASG